MSNVKAFLIAAMFVMSLAGGPLMIYARAQETTTADDIDTAEGADQLGGALGQIFGMFQGFGASGETLGKVLQMMFTDFENMSNTKKAEGIYVLNASLISDPVNGTVQYTDTPQRAEYEPLGVYHLNHAGVAAEYLDERPYFVLEETGNVSYNVTDGVQAVFTIWDSDSSLINALDTLINAMKNLQGIESSGDTDKAKQDAAISEVVETITYFLIHINDIITGDEMLIFNLMAFSNYQADFDFIGNAKWFVTENGIKTDTVELDTVYPAWKADFNATAKAIGDDFMLWLLSDEFDTWLNTARYQDYTRFSNDIIEIWLKHFEVHIDVAAILTAVNEAEEAAKNDQNYDANQGALADKTLTDIFQGLDIEFYIFTHHFQNWYLYDDNKFANTSVDLYNNTGVQAMVNNGVPDVIFSKVGEYDGKDVMAMNDTECEYYILPRGANNWEFHDPVYDTANQAMTWGLRANNLKFRVLPIGMRDEDVSIENAPIQNMSYFEIGFTFNPIPDEPVTTTEGEETSLAHAKVKFDQKFGRWNNGLGPKNTEMINITGMDLTTVMMSTILHVHLLIENKQITEEGESADASLLSENNYNKEEGTINVGNADSGLPLASIDIAGPNYVQNDSVTSELSNAPANTNIIPLVYANYTGQHAETYEQKDNSTGAISANLQIEFSVLLYAISFSTFDGSGDEIIHDPTFSVFFTLPTKTYWAILLVIGMIALVGIAAIIITKKKNATAGKA